MDIFFHNKKIISKILICLLILLAFDICNTQLEIPEEDGKFIFKFRHGYE